MKVPFNDLNRIHKPIKKTVMSKLDHTIDKSEFILSNSVLDFEKNFAKYTNSKYAISCSSGTDAIELILRALNIGHGDEVIIPSNTFIATALAVTRTGAKPIFTDNNNFYLIDVEKIVENISNKTKAIIGVHLYGQQADNVEIKKICKENGLFYIEDSAQAHGSTFKENSPGKYGVAAAYSFYPGKNLGAWGDGGAITTNNGKLAEKLISIRNWGSKKKYIHDEIGFNSRLNTLQAIVLSEKLNYINDWNKQRNKVANLYLSELIEFENLILPETFYSNYHTWHLFVIRVPNRNNFMSFMNESGVELGIHYPIPIHNQKAYKYLKTKSNDLKNSENFSKKIVSLPIFPLMTSKELDYTIHKIKDYFMKK